MSTPGLTPCGGCPAVRSALRRGARGDAGRRPAGRRRPRGLPARALDRLGEPTFRGLLAPLVVDSYALQATLLARRRRATRARGRAVARHGRHRRAPGRPRARDDGRQATPARLGLPVGDLRRPALSCHDLDVPLAGRRRATAATGGDENRFDGVEQSLPEIVAHRYAFVTPGRTVALNATLWPRVSVVVMNAAAYRRLSSEQRSALSRAGSVAIGPATAELVREEAEAIAVLCRPPHDDANLFQLIWLTPSGRRSLQRAVRPVLRRIGRDPASRAAIAAADAARPRLPSPHR